MRSGEETSGRIGKKGFTRLRKRTVLKKGRIRKQPEKREWRNVYSRSWWMERNRGEVGELYAIDVYTVSEVTQHRRGRYGISSPRADIRVTCVPGYPKDGSRPLGLNITLTRIS